MHSIPEMDFGSVEANKVASPHVTVSQQLARLMRLLHSLVACKTLKRET